jgi:hypothetical protein
MNSIVKEKQYISNVLQVPFENLSQSYLQKGIALGTQSVINFPVQTSQVASPLVTDNLLNLNDEFVCTHLLFKQSHAKEHLENLLDGVM